MSRARAWIARCLRERGATAALEFALLCPVFTIVLAGTVDLGNLLFYRFELDSAISAGANFALVNASMVEPTDGATLASNIAQVVGNSVGNGWANATVVVNNGPVATLTSGTVASSGSATGIDGNFYCPTGSGASLAWGSPLTSNSTACTGGGYPGKFVSIQASVTFTPIFSGYSFTPSGTQTVYTMVQVQ